MQMTETQNIRLGLFMSRGMGLADWHQAGLLDRELVLYCHLLRHMAGLTVFTYGGRREKVLADHYASIRVLPAYLPIFKWLYGYYGPSLRSKELAKCHVLKTNQMKGAMAAVRAKKLVNKPLIVRGGYVWSDPVRGHTKARRKKILQYEKICFDAADKIVLSSQRNCELVIKTHDLPRDKVICIPNYVDTSTRTLSRREPEKGTVLFVGRLTGTKNVDVLIEAAEQVDAVKKLIIIGDGHTNIFQMD